MSCCPRQNATSLEEFSGVHLAGYKGIFECCCYIVSKWSLNGLIFVDAFVVDERAVH